MSSLAPAIVDEDKQRSLAQALPAVAAPRAAAAKLVHDRRFITWARSFTAGLVLDVASTDSSPGEPSLRLHVCTSAGAVTLVIPRLASTLSALITDLATKVHLQEQACALASAWLRSIQETAHIPIQAISVREALPMPAERPQQPDVPCLVIGGCVVQVLELESTLCDDVTRRMAAQVGLQSTASWLRVRSRLRVALQTLPIKTLRSLAVGDVLLAPSRPLPAMLHIGDGDALGAPANLSDAPYRVTLTGPLISIEPEPLLMSTDASETDNVLNKLPVSVSFELETSLWTLEQIASMGAGQIVPLQTPPDQATVCLICQGRVIGHGQLLSLGAHLGVRISQTQWPLDDAL